MSQFEDRIVDLIPGLRRYAVSLARNRDDAEDLLQDSIETALSQSRGWRGDNLKGWLATIMTNLYRNQWRRRVNLSTVVETRRIVDQPAGPDAFERSRLVAALNRLDADQRAVLMLVVVEGYAYAEVASMLSIPIGTVMSRLSRARRHLAEHWDNSNVVELRRPS